MTTPQQYNTPSADDFLLGGGGAPSAKFVTPGTVIAGRITQQPTVQQQRDIQTGEKKFWNDGNPMMQLVVTIQTDQRDPSISDDDGQRRLFIKGALQAAVADAVRTAGATGLEVGGHLTVTYTHDGTPKQRGFSAPKQYTATYMPAAAAELLSPAPNVDPWQAPATALPQPAPAAAAPAPAAFPGGLTPEQYAAAQASPALAALLTQQAAAQAVQASADQTPPF